jgi:hypothetical protein
MGGSIFSSPISGQDKIIRGLEREDLFAVVSEQFLTDTAPRVLNQWRLGPADWIKPGPCFCHLWSKRQALGSSFCRTPARARWPCEWDAAVLTNRSPIVLATKWKPTRRLTIRFVSQLITAMRQRGCAHVGWLVARSRPKAGRDRIVFKAWWRVPLYRHLAFAGGGYDLLPA